VLSAYRVLDLTDHRGQLAGHILRSLGAEVILVEPPGGSPARELGPFVDDVADLESSLGFWAHNRGKASVVMDLESPAGIRELLGLVAGADVLIDNASVGVMSDLGLAYDDLAAVNDALVHVSITPFGQTGPKSRWATSDLTLQAASGALFLTGDSDRAPLRFGPAPQSWYHGAAEAASAALVALYERDNRSGRGQHVDISVQQSVNLVASAQMLAPALGATPTGRSAGGASYGGIDVRLMWPCADGLVSVTLLFGAAIGPFTRRLMEWVYEEGFCDERTRDKDWVDYAMMLLDGRESSEEYERIRDGVLTEFFASKTKAELLQAAVDRRLLIAPVASIADVSSSPQLADRGFWEEVDYGDLGSVTFPGPIARPHLTPLEQLPRSPRIGEHTHQILAAAPRPTPVDIAAPATTASSGPALAGLKVLDLMWVLAGPIASRVLADHGAEVILVESARRIDTARTFSPFADNETGVDRSGAYNTHNVNKRCLALDLTDPASEKVMLDLISWADVVLDSFSPRGMASLGYGHERLLTIKPELIVASTNLNGQTGPLAQLAGFGTMAAAMSGFFNICGWPDRAPSGPFGAYTDYVAPRYFLSALLAAVEHRRRTGLGQYIDFSQAEASIHNLSPLLVDYFVNGRVAIRPGNDDANSAPHGVYPGIDDDSWVAIACETDHQWRSLCAVVGHPLSPLAKLGREDRLGRRREVDSMVAAWTATRTADQVTAELQASSVPSHPVANADDVWADPQLNHRGHFVELPHGTLGTTWVIGSRFGLSRTPASLNRAGPSLGEDTYEILSNILGYHGDHIANLAAAGILE
jgi:crotonobetainyl-CoA:carnitine CoA-transferase CaiB-like acyl-CoA transferase